MTGLFGTLELGKSALLTQQLGLTIVGQNMANVNTEGYTRQRAELATNLPLVTPNYIIGRGVNVEGINHLRNEFIEDQLIAQLATQGKYTVQENAFSQVEVIYNEPSEYSVAGLFDNFWNAWQDLSINPESYATRMTVRESGDSLINKISELYDLTEDFQFSLDESIELKVNEINTITEAIHRNNKLITQLELSGEKANDLRDIRDQLIKDLAQIVDITVRKKENGSVDVLLAGRIIANEARFEALTITKTGGSATSSEVAFSSQPDMAITGNLSGGEIGGYLYMRDEVVSGLLTDIDTFARQLIIEINSAHSSGAGLDGFESVIGTYFVRNTTTALSESGLITPMNNGSFTVDVLDADGEVINSYTIAVDPSTESLEDLVANINAADGTPGGGEFSASIGSDNSLIINAGTGSKIRFREDTANVLAALGVNTFFTGTGARDIAINSNLENINLIATSSTGSPGENDIALEIATLRAQPVFLSGTTTFEDYYQSMISGLGANSNETQILKENQDLLVEQLQIRRESVSGVSLDEETAEMIKFEHAYSAAARIITVVDEMIQTILAMAQ